MATTLDASRLKRHIDSMREDYLFVNGDLHAVLESQKQKVKEKVESLNADYLLNVNEQELVASIVSEMELEVPIIRDADIHVAEHGKAQIDVSGDPRRAIFREGPFYVTGNKTVVAVPFDGNGGFFKIKPNTLNYNPSSGSVVGQEIRLTYIRADQDAAQLKQQYQHDVDSIKQYLQWQRPSVDAYNSALPGLVKGLIANRKQTLVGNSRMVESLGLPMKRREGAPTTFTVPVQRKKPVLERPKAVPAARPEPTLSVKDYESILGTSR
jgi:hypothetical protein